MFSLFRKDGFSQQPSLHESLAENQVPASDSTSMATGERDACGASLARSAAPSNSTGPEIVEAALGDPAEFVSDATGLSASGIDEMDDLEPRLDSVVCDEELLRGSVPNGEAVSADEPVHSDRSWLDDLPEPLRTGKTRRFRSSVLR